MISRIVAPWVISFTATFYVKYGESIAPICIVLCACVHLETSHITGEIWVTWVTVTLTGTTIAVGGFVKEQLQILIGIVVFLALKTERHEQLSPDMFKIILGGVATCKKTGTGHRLITVFVIAFIIGSVLISLDDDVFHCEGIAAGYAGAGGDGTVCVSQAETALVQNLEAILARCAVLVLVGVCAWRVLGYLHFAAVVDGVEGQRAGLVGEVLPRDGAEGDSTVIDGLCSRGVARAGNNKLASA